MIQLNDQEFLYWLNREFKGNYRAAADVGIDRLYKTFKNQTGS